MTRLYHSIRRREDGGVDLIDGTTEIHLDTEAISGIAQYVLGGKTDRQTLCGVSACVQIVCDGDQIIISEGEAKITLTAEMIESLKQHIGA